MKTLWRGNANAWECDELNHLNVRFYLAKLDEALGVFCEDIGMHGAYAPGATSYLKPRAITVRFLAEARPGTPLEIRAGVLDIGSTSVTLAVVMNNCAQDIPSASYVIELDHVSPRSGKVFPWAERMLEQLHAMKVQLPDICKTRSVDDHDPARFSRQQAEANGMAFVSRGLILNHQTNAHAEMRLEFAFGKISEGVIHFITAFPGLAEAYRSEGPLEVSSAVLEAKLNFHHFPRAGTGYTIHSGVSYADEKVRNLVHWVTDSNTGAPLWSMQAVTCAMDLKARRLKRLEGADLEHARSIVNPDLRA